ncbi:hypothetical protein AOLI_G00217730 [Acnodon oligacanthus]
MTDSEQTFLCTAITEVLPDLSEVTKDILEETLQSIGVETYNDFQFIELADLRSVLRPIQARKVLAAWKLRCQTAETSSFSVSASPGPSAFLQTISPRSSSSASSSSCQSPEIDEKEYVMFSYVEDTCLAGELTTTIIVCGRTCYSAGRFMPSVDRSIVQDNIPSFVSALCMMFGSYYCFTIHYPSELASTLEFLQRLRNCCEVNKILERTSGEADRNGPNQEGRKTSAPDDDY